MHASFLVDLLRGDPGARAFLERTERGSEALRVPAVTALVLLEGMARARHPPRNAEAVRDVLRQATTLPFTLADAEEAARVAATAAEAGTPLDVTDAMVAGVALARDEALVTRAKRDFDGVERLRVIAY